jgi:hypothetical protein
MPHQRDEEWAEAKRRCRLTEEAVRMAKELGMSPRSLMKNIPSKQQRWKAPVEDWVRNLHGKRFGERTPSAPAPAGPAIEELFPPEPPPDAPNQLERARDKLFSQLERGELNVDSFAAEESALENDTPVSGGEINETNRILRMRYDCFRQFAELFARAAARLDFVQRIVLFGSVAAPLKKEVPRFRRFRREHIAVWHECKDVDLAVWVSDLSRLRQLKRAISDVSNLWQTIANQKHLPGMPHHAVDVFIMEPGTQRYRGNLCHYGQCPKGKPECEVAGCGAQPFLQLYEDFKFDRSAPFSQYTVVLFDRAAAEPASTDETIPF